MTLLATELAAQNDGMLGGTLMGPDACIISSLGEVRVASRGQEIVSVASRVVNPKHDELRPAVSKELHQLHRKIWAYKMSKSWKVLTQFYCTLLYTQFMLTYRIAE
jgi:hypothetical protein